MKNLGVDGFATTVEDFSGLPTSTVIIGRLKSAPAYPVPFAHCPEGCWHAPSGLIGVPETCGPEWLIAHVMKPGWLIADYPGNPLFDTSLDKPQKQSQGPVAPLKRGMTVTAGTLPRLPVGAAFEVVCRDGSGFIVEKVGVDKWAIKTSLAYYGTRSTQFVASFFDFEKFKSAKLFCIPNGGESE